eukprot:1486455-Heterocapsa_arctica.AAC.1
MMLGDVFPAPLARTSRSLAGRKGPRSRSVVGGPPFLESTASSKQHSVKSETVRKQPIEGRPQKDP